MCRAGRGAVAMNTLLGTPLLAGGSLGSLRGWDLWLKRYSHEPAGERRLSSNFRTRLNLINLLRL